ncbi:hypothetical protein E9549_02495 [Blastococcus sp. MG754426]|uniref:hypothetical protein n=1 Tax=unclassified Blastococcus TaxID=2619396 RepID=UPI001EF155C2|nr:MULTISPECIES: hypothetical protein [unclassified Blastococcus]MCF6506280.1 hypothetical protein [Blastococcus sp. MG754426]MCF6510904.1 hypothetical protein [Blastococcus sp. MG754427]MCF6733870.1 hypothetical protein [Blastococcus sp. KM273129]
MRNVQRAAIRAVATAGLAAGLALALRPARTVGAVDPRFPRERLWATRVLGARLVAQHAALLVRPRPSAARAAAAVDALHAASMLPLLASPAYRRTALVSGGFAAATAGLLAAAARSEGR